METHQWRQLHQIIIYEAKIAKTSQEVDERNRQLPDFIIA